MSQSHYEQFQEYLAEPEKLTELGFTLHHGGDCPVDPDCAPYVIFRDGGHGIIELAKDLDWSHMDDEGDIIAWKVENGG